MLDFVEHQCLMRANDRQEGSWVLFQYSKNLFLLLSFKKADMLHIQFHFQNTLYHTYVLNRKLGDWFQESDRINALICQILNIVVHEHQ